jgi:hypothetical protein
LGNNEGRVVTVVVVEEIVVGIVGFGWSIVVAPVEVLLWSMRVWRERGLFYKICNITTA